MDSIRAGVQPNTHKHCRAALEDVRSSPESFIRVHQHHAPVNTMKPKSLCVPRLGLFEDTGVRYRRQVDSGSPEQSLDQPAESPRDPHFTLLQPERSPYQQLVEDDSQHRLKEEKKTKKKEKYKKYKKVGRIFSLGNMKKGVLIHTVQKFKAVTFGLFLKECAFHQCCCGGTAVVLNIFVATYAFCLRDLWWLAFLKELHLFEFEFWVACYFRLLLVK